MFFGFRYFENLPSNIGEYHAGRTRHRKKTVAILEGGRANGRSSPQLHHVLEPLVCSRPADRAGLRRANKSRACRAPVVPCAHVLALGIQHRQGGRTAAQGNWRLECSGVALLRVPDRQRAWSSAYLEPLACQRARLLKDHIPNLKPRSRRGRPRRLRQDEERAMAASLSSPSPFATRTARALGEQLKADAVIDATGTWFSPNPAGVDGLPALGEERDHPQIAYGMPDVLGRERSRYAGKTVAVLGAGHSGDRHADRSGAASRTRRWEPKSSTAVAWRQARKGLRRWCQRQAGGARRAWRSLRRPCRRRQDSRRGQF